MAGNKFATMLNKNTSRITVILVYTILEWLLIILLLLNSFFAYVIGKFVSYFGLKPPCLLCCRVDHVLEPEKKEWSSYIDTVCEAHAKEISRLGYCLNHMRLVEACQTCEDCSLEWRCSQGSLIASVSPVGQADDGDDKELKCFCCGIGLEDGFYSKYFFKNELFKPAWDVLKYTHKGTLAGGDDDNDDDEEEKKKEKEEKHNDDDGADDDEGQEQKEEEEDGDGGKQEEADAEEEKRRHYEKSDVAVVNFRDDGSKEKKEEEHVVVVREEEVEVVDESIDEETKGSAVVFAAEDSSCDVLCVCVEDSSVDERVIPVKLLDSVAERNVLKEKTIKESDDNHPHLLDDLDVYFQRKCFGKESPAHSRDYLSIFELYINFVKSSNRKDEDSQQLHPEIVGAADNEFGVAAITEQVDADREGEGLIRVSLISDGQITASETKETIDVQEKAVALDDGGAVHEENSDHFQEDVLLSTSLNNNDGVDLQRDIICNLLPVEEDQELEQSKEASISDGNGDEKKDIVYTVLLAEEDHGLEQKKNSSSFDDDNGDTQKDVRIVSLNEEGQVREEIKDSTIDDDSDDVREDLCTVFLTKGEQEVKQKTYSMVDDDNGNARKDVYAVVLAEEDQGLEQIEDSTIYGDNDDARKENVPVTQEDQRLGQTKEPNGCHVSAAVVMIEKMKEQVEDLSTGSEFNEIDDEKAPETPTYIEGIHTLQKRPMIERKDSGKESFDGSVISDIEAGEAVVIERLKTALKTERMALNALYAELEEERNAAAIAANQTMAMITRLQEEKAGMQMEALQYQRMMEEQSEYDQEALQLMNELMVKREREMQELEKELELYRKKVRYYEAREKRMKKIKSSENIDRRVLDHKVGSSLMSSPSSSAWDSDELSVDFDDEDDGSDAILDSNQNTTAETVLDSTNGHENTKELTTLNDSMADFERERLSILKQLKALEEKLSALSDEEGMMASDRTSGDHKVRVLGESIDKILEEPCHKETDAQDQPCGESVDMNGILVTLISDQKHPARSKYTGSKPKRLLPLFNGTNGENAIEEHKEASFSHSDVQFSRHAAIEEEVEQVYVRLRTLEADREFLQYCINSLKKGDKGMGLLREILQNLRDLRAVELRERNLTNPTP